MPRYRVPDHLVCLGGGGVEVGKTYMQQDWILEEVIRENPREGGDSTEEEAHPLHAYFIDSDGSSLPDRIEEEVEGSVEDIEKEYDTENHPLVDVNTIQISEGAHEDFLTSETVVSESQMSDLLTDEGFEAWWLSDSGDLLKPLGGLQRGGVDRKRGLTKAIYRISQWKDDKLSDIEQTLGNVSDPNVAIVVGLGGGTGSGLCLDIAKQIRDAGVGATVTLFGILPKPSGDDDVSVLANAYATLSELEYLALSDENYFENIMLLPFDPAKDEDIFDKSAVYTINGYYNLNSDQTNTFSKFDETESDGPPKYAPFTLCSTKYLYYPKENTDMIKENFKRYLKNKQAAIEKEEKLYDRIEDFVESGNSDAADELSSTDGNSDMRLPDSDALALQARIDRVREFLDADFMNNLEFRCTEELKSDLEDIESTAEDKATWNLQPDKEAAVAREFAERVSKIDTESDYRPESGWATDEQRFVELLTREFELITRRAGIIRASSAIESEASDPDSPEAAIATDINNAIDKSHSGFGTEIEDSKPDKKLSDIKDEIDQLDTLVSEGEDTKDTLIEKWADDIESAVTGYYEICKLASEINTLLDELQGDVDSALDISRTREPATIQMTGTDFGKYSKLNNKLRKVGCDEVDKDEVESSVNSAQEAVKKRYQAERRNGSIIESIKSFFGSGTISKFKGDYSNLRRTDINSDIVSLSEWRAELDVGSVNGYFDRTTDFKNRKKGFKNEIRTKTANIVKEAKSRREDPDEFLSDDDNDVEQRLNQFSFGQTSYSTSKIIGELDPDDDGSTPDSVSSASELVAELKSGSTDNILSALLIDPFENRKSKKVEKKEQLDEKKERYESLETIVEEDGGSYSSALDSVGGIGEITADSSTSSTEFREVVDSSRLSGSDDLGDTDIWGKERDKTLKRMREEMVPDIGDDHLPVHESKIAHSDTEQTFYDGYRTASTFMCRFFEEYSNDDSAEISLVTDRLNGINYIDEDDYLTGRGTFADKFDFSVTTFLTGVFLDNLKIFTEDCRVSYTSLTDVSSGDDIHNPQSLVPGAVEHHTYGIDGKSYHEDPDFLPDSSDGGFCYRRDIVQPGNDSGQKTLLDQEEEREKNNKQVAQKLREEYYEVVGYPTTIEPS